MIFLQPCCKTASPTIFISLLWSRKLVASAYSTSSRSAALFASFATRLTTIRAQSPYLTCTLSSSSSSSVSSTLSTRLHSTSMTSNNRNDMENVSYLDAQSAYDLDQDLMAPGKFTLEQLMELAGLSVAQAVFRVVQDNQKKDKQSSQPKVLIVCGPGNNGGDGLVAARHLVLMGYNCAIICPKLSKHEHFERLMQQCRDSGVRVIEDMLESTSLNEFDVIVDAIFGFSFKGEPRDPFKNLLEQMKDAQQKHDTLLISVDVPSGWNVDEGDVSGLGLMPDALISLTVPKKCAKQFTGRHFVGGRFLPPVMADKYNIRLPSYPGSDQFVELMNNPFQHLQQHSEK